jgi:hypothetical protein
VQRPTDLTPLSALGSAEAALVVATQVEGYSLVIGRHIHHSAFPLADVSSSQSDEA